ncbi:DUF397 domain-containing protein [Actinomadura sp. NBRC 104425]|uniref:DUF397 domain-containing protein n=1 Tax=Actinomadura sp. NBRC 104425 TaxID=3032204 RepID=UPI00255530BA|nr:DUF397 domain-containing protein [Actinomadura sp. NBRC 104425]
MRDDPRCVVWRKSSRSGSSGGECVEVARLEDACGVRDSKAPQVGYLAIDRGRWVALLAEIKQGTYDL